MFIIICSCSFYFLNFKIIFFILSVGAPISLAGRESNEWTNKLIISGVYPFLDHVSLAVFGIAHVFLDVSVCVITYYAIATPTPHPHPRRAHCHCKQVFAIIHSLAQRLLSHDESRPWPMCHATICMLTNAVDDDT